MGGRGGSSGIRNEKPVSRLLANTYYNSAKKVMRSEEAEQSLKTVR